MVNKNTVLEFIKKNDFCVLSTSSKTGKSESAVMALTVKDDFTLLMNTAGTTRKIINLLENPQVSVIVGGLKNDPSVQIDGKASVIEGDEAKTACAYMLNVHPELKDYGIETGKFISITPNWLRWVDFTQNPPVIEEFTF